MQIRKRQINLGRDKEAAWKKYHELMLDQSEPDEVDYVVDLLDLYRGGYVRLSGQGYQNRRSLGRNHLAGQIG